MCEVHNDDFFEDISMETSEDASCDNTTISMNSEFINFNIYLSAEKWKLISPVTKRYCRKRDRHHKSGTRTYLTIKR